MEGDKGASSSAEFGGGQGKEAADEEKKEKGDGVAAGDGKEKGEKKEAATLAEVGFITVHLKMPGVPQAVDVMVISLSLSLSLSLPLPFPLPLVYTTLKFLHSFQLTSRDTVHDLLQYALERPECCYRTALSVRHKGKRLDDFFEIGSVEGLRDGDTVELVEGKMWGWIVPR